MGLFMGTVLMGTVLFLFETLTAGMFSSGVHGPCQTRPCVIILHLIAKGRGHRVAGAGGGYQNETLAAYCWSHVEAVGY